MARGASKRAFVIALVAQDDAVAFRLLKRRCRGQAVHPHQASEATPSSTAMGERSDAVFDGYAVQNR
jgi:hypothetical protein